MARVSCWAIANSIASAGPLDMRVGSNPNAVGTMYRRRYISVSSDSGNTSLPLGLLFHGIPVQYDQDARHQPEQDMHRVPHLVGAELVWIRLQIVGQRAFELAAYLVVQLTTI